MSFIAATILITAASCASEPEGPVEFTIEPGAQTLIVGQSVQLSAIGPPGTVTWSSSNSNIASVVPTTGLVTGMSQGTATITAVSGPSYSSVTIAVNPDPAQVHAFATIAPIFTTAYPVSRGGLACSGCHVEVSGGQAYDWVKARVTAGDPNAGILVCKITSGASCPNPMPLPAAQIQAVKDWITAGANR